MELSVIIVNYNAASVLERCLMSLDHHLENLPHEICVVDNGSTDGSRTLIKSRFPHVQLIANDQNAGFTVAINQGLRKTSGRTVLWLNPDTEILDADIQALLRYLKENPRVGILGPMLLNTDGQRQFSCRSFPSHKTALFNRYSLLTRWFPRNPFSQDYLHSDWNSTSIIQKVDWVSGACLLHRREVSDVLGGLDERFFIYCEDVDFCLRAYQAGWETQYYPEMRVLHHVAEGGSRHKSVARRMVVERHRSMWRYYAKHFKRNPLKDLATGTVLWLRCAARLLL